MACQHMRTEMHFSSCPVDNLIQSNDDDDDWVADKTHTRWEHIYHCINDEWCHHVIAYTFSVLEYFHWWSSAREKMMSGIGWENRPIHQQSENKKKIDNRFCRLSCKAPSVYHFASTWFLCTWTWSCLFAENCYDSDRLEVVHMLECRTNEEKLKWFNESSGVATVCSAINWHSWRSSKPCCRRWNEMDKNEAFDVVNCVNANVNHISTTRLCHPSYWKCQPIWCLPVPCERQTHT